ncbi:MAG: ACP S-malonyltransferase [Chloroflexota bacterium]|nr:ACP S-malonyltransferase [Chloroflexota bacterium]
MADLSQTAFVFPGQGSQVVGMGKDVGDAHPVARDTFTEADALLGYPLSHLCFEGPEDDLNDTYYTQPALFVCSMALLRALQTLHPEAKPRVMAGHSLGELTALCAAGAYSFADGLRLVQARGRLMKEAGEQHPGAMAAIIGLDTPTLQALVDRAVQETGAILVSANDNSPGQVVVSGEVAAVDKAVELGKSFGARLVRKLPVSIASHSPLMADAARAFGDVLNSVTFETPVVPVYGNVNAAPLTTPDAIRNELEAQLTSPVRWTESVAAMVAARVKTFVEIGSKDVLTGLIKRIDDSAARVNVNSAPTLQAYAETLMSS